MQILHVFVASAATLKVRTAGALKSSGNSSLQQQPDLQKELKDHNDKIVKIWQKNDALSLQCKKTADRDAETIAGLTRELQAISGQLAGNVAQQSSAGNSADRDKKMVDKLNAQAVQVDVMCKTQEAALNKSVSALSGDQSQADVLRQFSGECKARALAAIQNARTPATISSLRRGGASFLEGCGREVLEPMMATGKSLANEARNFSTSFARKAFEDALLRASEGSAFPVLKTERKEWPSRSKPRSKSQEKAANSCKVPEGSVNCNVLESELETLARRLEEQKDKKLTEQRKQVDDCNAKRKDVNERLQATEAQISRSQTEMVRTTGIKAKLAAQRAAVEQRLERAQKDSKDFQKTCKNGKDEYQGQLEEVMRDRQQHAHKIVGEKVLIPDCEVSDWRFSVCSKACKKSDDDAVGTMEATRTVVRVAGLEGASCPPLVAKLSCNDKPCPTDCEVSEWLPWGSCSKACGGGTESRTRKVTTQVKDGGKKCPAVEQRKSCNIGSCSDECKLKEWTPWSACSRRCKFSTTSAAGRQVRTRDVDGNPVKRGGGSPCPPSDDDSRLQAQPCNEEICPRGVTCDASQDVLVFLDSSGDADAEFQHEVSLVSAMVERSSKKTGYGIISYGKEIKILSRITPSPDLAGLAKYAPPAGGIRDTAGAVTMGRSLFGDPGIGGTRPKTALLLLGGAPATFTDSEKAAEDLRSAGVRVVVGLIDDGNTLTRQQACSLASKPCSANVEAVKSWQQLEHEPGRFLAAICRDLVYPNSTDLMDPLSL
jgi:hypothetical protein